MRISLLAGEILSRRQYRSGLVRLAGRGVQHRELQIGREVVGPAGEEMLQLGRCLRRVALALQFERQGVPRKWVVGRGGNEVSQLFDAIHETERRS